MPEMSETRYVDRSSPLPRSIPGSPFPRHYSYECKASTQERPYQPRPSRTQQLLNPKLVPKLTSDTPNDLLRKTGIADEQLAKREAQRALEREREDLNATYRHGSRPASPNASSVSTISTNLSRSPSPRNHTTRSKSHHSRPVSVGEYSRSSKKRRRRSRSTSVSYSSTSSYVARDRSLTPERNTRRRRSSFSPDERGRKRSTSRTRPIRRESRSRGFDPRARQRSRTAGSRDGVPSDDSLRHQAVKHGRSSSPSRRRQRQDLGRPEYGGRQTQAQENEPLQPCQNSRAFPTARKDRSRSPFSKRLALTQAMNMGS